MSTSLSDSLSLFKLFNVYLACVPILFSHHTCMSRGFAGNTDLYGLGIRIGYYAQALAVWFSNYFHYRETKGFRAVNDLFLLALVVAAIIYFANASSVHVVEAFLLLQIGLVIGLIGITERSRFSSKYIKNSKERMITRMATIMAGGLLNVCFWWKGLHIMLPTPSPLVHVVHTFSNFSRQICMGGREY